MEGNGNFYNRNIDFDVDFDEEEFYDSDEEYYYI